MTGRLRPPLPTVSLDRTRQLRNPTADVGNDPWYHLRAGRLGGVKFRRQHPFPPYVVDFHCHAARLVIELDGSQRDAKLDQVGTGALARRGLKVLRFTDFDVLENEVAVRDTAIVAPPPLSPTPLPVREGIQCEQSRETLPSEGLISKDKGSAP